MRIYEIWNGVQWVEIKLEELPCSVHYIRIKEKNIILEGGENDSPRISKQTK